MDCKILHGLHPSSLCRTRPGGLVRYPAHDDVPMATDGDDISIHSTMEMEKNESLYQREFGHTHVYNVNMLEGVGMDEELPTILRAIGWEKL
jgi:hypothetical protein